MRSALLLSAISLLVSVSASSLSTIYWPVTHPSRDNPWVLGQKNILAWTCGGGTGIQSFDIQLHNANYSIMNGFIPIALRVPMERLPTGRKNFGGEIEVDLNPDMPSGDGFRLIFINTLHGQVYSQSPKFSIYPTRPSNYTAPDLPTATVTATLTHRPDPTQQWAITLNGIDPDVTKAATAIAGGSGGSS